MKVRPISDIHLEFGEFNLPIMEDESEQVLCINGDLNPARCLWEVEKASKSTEYFFSSLQDRFKDVLYISGNHEYYHGDISKDDEEFKRICDVFGYTFLQNGESKEIDDTTFIGATLWTDFDQQDPDVMFLSKRSMNDYRCISDSSREPNPSEALWHSSTPFTPRGALELHYKHKKKIFEEIFIAKINNPDKKVVVMTHHAPHAKSIHPQYQNDMLNGAYYSDLEYEILKYNPNLWMHGHVHNKFDYMVGNTRVVCNPRGYLGYEKSEYNNEWVIEI